MVYSEAERNSGDRRHIIYSVSLAGSHSKDLSLFFSPLTSPNFYFSISAV